MNYIVMDLEWNQSAGGKSTTNPEIPFEIIQIGAVKLDENLIQIDEFNEFISPSVYDEMHFKVREMLDYDMTFLKENGDSFTRVAKRFIKWCGDDFVFCTWGSLDLTELQRNMAYYKVANTFPFPFLFFDVQKMYSLDKSDGKSRITLQRAIEELKLLEEGGFHSADMDAKYTAKVMRNINLDAVKKYVSVDTYHIPQSKKQEIFLDFDTYGKYISRGFASREKAVLDREVRSCRCYKCNQPMVRVVKWFVASNKNYYGVFNCKEHGFMRGKFKAKSTDDDKAYVIKIFGPASDEDIEMIKQKKKKEQANRRRKRKAN